MTKAPSVFGRAVAIDTGPLLLLLVLAYVRDTNANQSYSQSLLRDVLPDSIPPLEFDSKHFDELMVGYMRLFTTPHVLTEVFKLRDRSHLKKIDHAFRESALTTLKKVKIEEVQCPIQDLSTRIEYRRLVCDHGLTDAALLLVAAQSNCSLLTVDVRLQGASQRVILLQDLLNSERDE